MDVKSPLIVVGTAGRRIIIYDVRQPTREYRVGHRGLAFGLCHVMCAYVLTVGTFFSRFVVAAEL